MSLLTHEERTKIRHIKTARTTPNYRTFINIEDGHNKFWKIGRLNYVVYTQYGAIDAVGVQVVKKFPGSWSASEYVDTKISEKLRKGYEEI